MHTAVHTPLFPQPVKGQVLFVRPALLPGWPWRNSPRLPTLGQACPSEASSQLQGAEGSMAEPQAWVCILARTVHLFFMAAGMGSHSLTLKVLQPRSVDLRAQRRDIYLCTREGNEGRKCPWLQKEKPLLSFKEHSNRRSEWLCGGDPPADSERSGPSQHWAPLGGPYVDPPHSMLNGCPEIQPPANRPLLGHHWLC